jgi:hypothetical protein
MEQLSASACFSRRTQNSKLAPGIRKTWSRGGGKRFGSVTDSRDLMEKDRMGPSVQCITSAGQTGSIRRGLDEFNYYKFRMVYQISIILLCLWKHFLSVHWGPF